MTKEWRPQKIVVHGRDSLSRVNVPKLHERRFVLRFKNKGDSQIQLVVFNEFRLPCGVDSSTNLGDVLILFILLPIVVNQGTTHSEIWNDRRMFFLNHCSVGSNEARGHAYRVLPKH